jgi:transcriptional regulator with XRE-family HTH domain
VSTLTTRFGQVIKACREQRGLSQEALADLAGISRSFLGEIERGEAAPSLDTLQKLANALGEKLSFVVIKLEELI